MRNEIIKVCNEPGIDLQIAKIGKKWKSNDGFSKYLQFFHQVQMKTFTLPSTYISNTNYEFGQVYHNLDQSKIVLDLQKDQTFVKPFEILCKDSYRSYCSYPSFMSGRPRLAKPLRRLGCRIEQGSDSGGTPLMAALPAKNWPWRP